MYKALSEKALRWMLPVMLILFILEVVSFPLVLSYTYAGRSEAPKHVLTYTQGKLSWDSATAIAPDGSAVLDVFDYIYPNAENPDAVSADGDNIVAPGTDEFNIVRLKNSVSGTIKYTAVLYRLRTDELLPVEAALTGEGFADTGIYPLPEGVSPAQVVRAVSGTLDGGAIQDFDISWLWQFYVSDAQDSVDTMLGNKLNPDEVTVGLYIVVEDGNSYVLPEAQSPKTGDDSFISLYVALMCISLFVLILMLLELRRRKAQLLADGNEKCVK